MTLAALLLLSLTIWTPVQAAGSAAYPGDAVPSQTFRENSISSRGPAPACTGYEAGGVLGREDGTLSLLGIDGSISPAASLLESGAFSLHSARSASASYVVFIRTECLGQLVAQSGQW